MTMVVEKNKAFSTFQGEQAETTSAVRAEYEASLRRAARLYKKSQGKEAEKLSDAEAAKILQREMRKILNDALRKYPLVRAISSLFPEVDVISDEKSLKKARKEYRAVSCRWGRTGLSYGLYELYDNVSLGEISIVLDVIAYVYLHEVGHSMFRLNTGKYECHSNTERMMHYINEYYADMWAFCNMGISKERAVKIMNYKFMVIEENSNRALEKKTHTHPSFMQRRLFLQEGVFDSSDIVQKVAKQINEDLFVSSIRPSDIKKVQDAIEEFKIRQPHVMMDMRMRP